MLSIWILQRKFSPNEYKFLGAASVRQKDVLSFADTLFHLSLNPTLWLRDQFGPLKKSLSSFKSYNKIPLYSLILSGILIFILMSICRPVKWVTEWKQRPDTRAQLVSAYLPSKFHKVCPKWLCSYMLVDLISSIYSIQGHLLVGMYIINFHSP